MPETDSLGRRFDPSKFLPRFDRLQRWINARAGRKKQNMETPDTTVTNTDAAAPAGAPEPTPPPPAPASGPRPPDAPSFDDINAAAAAPPPPPAAAAAAADDDDEESGTVETIIGLLQIALMLIGEEEGMLSEVEKRMLRRPLERVLKKYNVGLDCLPCELELAAAVATIIIARLRKPKTRSLLSRFFGWVGAKWGAFRGRRAGQDKLREKKGDE
ncbi:MAG: hypothetical protein LBC18_10780 [Opitutaceae bacterium]|nr:hypothetical protein [Opitutaceae bacterium]